MYVGSVLFFRYRSILIFLVAYWAYCNTPDEDDTDPKECHRRWATINALLALHYKREKEPRGWPGYGISVIRDGLEQENWKHPSSGLGESAITILDVRLPKRGFQPS